MSKNKDKKKEETKKYFKNIKSKSLIKAAVILLSAFFIICLISAVSVFFYQTVFADTIYPGVSYLGIDLSGKKFSEAQALVENKTAEYLGQPMKFSFEDKNVEIIPAKENIIKINTNDALLSAFSIGRQHDFLLNLKDQAQSILWGKKIPFAYEIDRDNFEKLLKDNFTGFETKPSNAQIKINDDFTYETIPQIDGKVFDYNKFIDLADENIKKQESVNIALLLQALPAEIVSNDLVGKYQDIDQIIKLEQISFKYQDKKWDFQAKEFKDWISFEKNGNIINLVFGKEALYQKLTALNAEIRRDPIDAKFKMDNSKVTEFVASQNGLDLNIAKSTDRINEEIIKNKNKEVELVADEILAEITTNTINDLGINELIGVGESNFSGSPSNRRTNIKVGANSLNGILIKPGEEFSLLTALGEIEASKGYLPELVIKGDRTVPELGGGLCQVATTMFRAAVNSGLPILERKGHKYRVTYYEPAGFDATIYDPSPDLKFVNDTKNYILIQSEISGNVLTFDFYGTTDGRKIDVQKPVVYNITSPGPTKMVETDTLAPGVKNCIERAHNGADAYFTRKVTYSDGTVKDDRWDTHYIAWQAVCLIGKDPAATTEQANAENEAPQG